MKFNKITTKTKLVSAISTMVITSALALPLVLATNNTNVSTQKSMINNVSQNSDTQIVNSVDQIVINDVEITSINGSAIVTNNGIQELYAWGLNTYGQLGVGDVITRTVPTKVLLDLPVNAVIQSFQIGYASFILFTVDGQQYVYVWGNNNTGQLGLSNTDIYSVPYKFNLDVFNGGVIRKFGIQNQPSSSGYAIIDKANNTSEMYVWGSNSYGQLGLGWATDKFAITPTLLPIPSAMAGWAIVDLKIATHTINYYSCYALFEKNGVVQPYTWGENGSGQLGLNHTSNVSVPTILSLNGFGLNTSDTNNGKIVEFYIEHANAYAVILRSNNKFLYTWGANASGQLGIGDTGGAPRTIPAGPIGLNGTLEKIIPGQSFGSTKYAIMNVGGIKRIYAWGYSVNGECGVNSSANAVFTPTLLSTSYYGDGTIEQLFAQASSSIFLTVRNSDGIQQVYAWGRNDYGQLGFGDTSTRYIPTLMTDPVIKGAEFKTIAHITNCESNIFELVKNGIPQYYVNGYNNNGQLGLGHKNNVNKLTEVLPIRQTKPVMTQFSSDLSAPDAFKTFYVGNTLNKNELAKYVDLSSFPPNAILSINKAKSIIDYKNGSIELALNTNQYYDSLIVDVNTTPDNDPKQYKVLITGFRPVKPFDQSPIVATTKLTDEVQQLDTTFSSLVDSNNNVLINKRDSLTQYFDLSGIPLSANIQLTWSTNATSYLFDVAINTNEIYNNAGQAIPYALHTTFSISLPGAPLNLGLILGLSLGSVALLGIIIAGYVIYRHKHRFAF